MSNENERPRPSRAATRLVSALVTEVSNRDRPAVRRLLVAARRMRLSVGDPAVRYNLDGTDLVLPLSHDLPVHRARYPDYSRNLGAVAAAVTAAKGEATVVDIGANVGDSVAIISAFTPANVLCVEGDPKFLPYLRRNVGSLANVEIEPSYVASAAVELGGRSALREGGTARLVDSPDAGESIRVRPLAEMLAERPRFEHPTLLKIDTDGHDAGIIGAAGELLDHLHPALFFEFDPPMTRAVGAPDPRDLFERLASWGYATFVVYTNLGGELGRFAAAQIGELRALSGELAPGQAVPYWDVLAVHAHDSGVLDHLPV